MNLMPRLTETLPHSTRTEMIFTASASGSRRTPTPRSGRSPPRPSTR